VPCRAVRLRRGRQGSRQGRLARPELFGESHAGEGREVQVRHQERRGGGQYGDLRGKGRQPRVSLTNC